MNTRIFIALLFLTLPALAQRPSPVTKADVENQRVTATQLYWGYQTAVDGWAVRKGDTLRLGRGTLPTKDFAFIYSNPLSLMSNGHRQYLQAINSGKRAIVKEMGQNGTKKTGYGIFVVVAVGELIRYYVELDNAIDAGEILPPPQFCKVTPSAPSTATVSVADELLKLKQLMDAGALTQDEYNAQKKKLLNH